MCRGDGSRSLTRLYSLAVIGAVDEAPHVRILILKLSHPVVQHVNLAGVQVGAVRVQILLVQAHLGQSAAAIDAGEAVVRTSRTGM